VISASKRPRMKVIQPWMSKIKTLPKPSPRGSPHRTPVSTHAEPLERGGVGAGGLGKATAWKGIPAASTAI
jgi:hypothetical protein